MCDYFRCYHVLMKCYPMAAFFWTAKITSLPRAQQGLFEGELDPCEPWTSTACHSKPGILLISSALHVDLIVKPPNVTDPPYESRKGLPPIPSINSVHPSLNNRPSDIWHLSIATVRGENMWVLVSNTGQRHSKKQSIQLDGTAFENLEKVRNFLATHKLQKLIQENIKILNGWGANKLKIFWRSSTKIRSGGLT